MLNFSPLFKLHTPWRFYESFSPLAQNEQVKEMTEVYSKYPLLREDRIFYHNQKLPRSLCFQMVESSSVGILFSQFLRVFCTTNLNIYRETTQYTMAQFCWECVDQTQRENLLYPMTGALCMLNYRQKMQLKF